jgi:hypothetical protein
METKETQIHSLTGTPPSTSGVRNGPLALSRCRTGQADRWRRPARSGVVGGLRVCSGALRRLHREVFSTRDRRWRFKVVGRQCAVVIGQNLAGIGRKSERTEAGRARPQGIGRSGARPLAL